VANDMRGEMMMSDEAAEGQSQITQGEDNN
jgi:hypothetical protein